MSDWAKTLDALLRERGGALFGYAYVLTGSAPQAEDLLQDALVRTFRSGRGTRDLNSAHAYVKRAITSAFIDSGHALPPGHVPSPRRGWRWKRLPTMPQRRTPQRTFTRRSLLCPRANARAWCCATWRTCP